MTSGPENTLINDDLLEFDGRDGIRSLCHLFVFYPAGGQRVCLVGNFEPLVGASTTSAIEAVATAVAHLLRQDEFRLFEWFPHRTGNPFAEVTLRRVQRRKVQYGRLLVLHAPDADATPQVITTRFVEPEWTGRSEDDIAQLVGESSIREMRSYAGIRGDYCPERLFGSAGSRKVKEIQSYNLRIAEHLQAQISEWSAGSR